MGGGRRLLPPPPPELLGSSTDSSIPEGFSEPSNKGVAAPRISAGFSLPPDALVYLFPEFFASRCMIGGFKSPYSGARVSHSSLYKALVSVSVAYMVYSRIASPRLVSVGRIFKHNEVELVRRARSIPNSQPLLASSLRGVKIGNSIRLIELIGRVIGGLTESPDKKYIEEVGSIKVESRINHRDRGVVARYRGEAEKLYNLWMRQKQSDPLLYRIVKNDADRAYKKYRYVETEY